MYALLVNAQLQLFRWRRVGPQRQLNGATEQVDVVDIDIAKINLHVDGHASNAGHAIVQDQGDVVGHSEMGGGGRETSE